MQKGEKKEDNWFWGQEKGQGQVNVTKNRISVLFWKMELNFNANL